MATPLPNCNSEIEGGPRATSHRRESVTPLRHFSGKMSGSRNGTKTRDGDWDWERSVDASCCYWCRERFAPGQMRYPILHDCKREPVSLCLDCFKHPDANSYDPAAMQRSAQDEAEATRASYAQYCQSEGRAPPDLPPLIPRTPVAPREERLCPGCGEPIFVSPNLRSSRLQFCSMRCYQRGYRKERRKYGGSTIQWKGGVRPRCEACAKLIASKRRDAKFCSDKCKQEAYRRRAAAVTVVANEQAVAK
jgi:endogenous inhibitor of DNA gyrase (YacG/DUF329 family)